MTENKFFNENDGKNHANSSLVFDQMQLGDLPGAMLKWIDHNSQAILMIFNYIGELQYVSQSIETILNIKPSQILGKHWKKVFVKTNKMYTKGNFFKTSNDVQQLKVTLNNSDGQIIWFESTISPICSNNEKFYMMSLVNISEKIKLEELIMQSEQLSVTGQLAAGIVHEIRNPLTSLKGFLQLLAAGVDAKDAYFKIMIDEINKIETITSELLFMAKPMTAHKQAESISCMIKEVVALLQSEARINSINIIMEELSDHNILCNRTQIKQALINIIKNAIEAVEANSKIMISTTTSDGFILIDIIDEGPGISEDAIHKISEPFYTTKQEGTGLGLMITQKIIDEHDGIMQVFKNPTKGSTFRLQLPIYKPD